MQAFTQLTRASSTGDWVISDSSVTCLIRAGQLWLAHNNRKHPRQHNFNLLNTPAAVVQVALAQDTCIAIVTESGQLWTRGGYVPADERQADNHFQLVRLPARVKQISASGALMAITENGELWARGYNEDGELGLGDREDRHEFTHIQLPEAVKQVDARLNTLVLGESGRLWTCGYNHNGQMGLGDNESRLRFTLVELATEISQVSAGVMNTAVIDKRGRLWTCGDNYYGQLGVNDVERIHRFVQVSLPEAAVRVSTTNGTLVLTASGRLWACGDNDKGRLGLPKLGCHRELRLVERLGTIKYFKAGYQHSLVYTDNGDIWISGTTVAGDTGLFTRISFTA